MYIEQGALANVITNPIYGDRGSCIPLYGHILKEFMVFDFRKNDEICTKGSSLLINSEEIVW